MAKSNKRFQEFLRKHGAKIITTSICLMLCAAILIFTVSATNTFKVIYNGVEYEVTTLRTDTDSIIKQSGINFDRDSNYVDDTQLASHGIIVIDSVCTVTVIDEEKSISLKTHGTVEDVLKEAKITLGKNDSIDSLSLSDHIEPGMTIKVLRGVSVMISVDGDITTVYVPKGSTIEEALNKAVITADDDDIISKPLDTVITSSTAVKITRVEVIERTVTQKVPFDTKEEKDSSLPKGQTKIKQQGADGEKTEIYADKYVNGELIESELKSSKVTKEPVACIKLTGTKVAAVSASAKPSKPATTKPSNSKPASSSGSGSASGNKNGKPASSVSAISTYTPPASLTLTANNVPTSYKKKIVGRATAYYGDSGTSTGAPVRPGVVAVDPREIPYQTAMWIVSNDGKFVYGYSKAQDTGGFIYTTDVLVDLYMPSLSACYDFGTRNVTVYIL